MATTVESSNRRIVPRWRSFRDALATRELDPTAIAESKGIGGEEFLRQREHEWLENKELPFATDLVGAACVLGDSEIAKEAADFILEKGSQAGALAQKLARFVLRIPEPPDIIRPSVSDWKIVAQNQIRNLKGRSRTEPRNAFVWTDLARLYVQLALTKPAERAIRVALALAPADRFVLRSAARFYLHIGENEQALRLLRRNERTKIDPWLMAAELAVSSVLEKTPKFGKIADQCLTSGRLPPFHASELASALASFEMWEGNDKRAKRLFNQSLIEPTENALAQGVWASNKIGLNVDEKRFSALNAQEAQALSAHIQHNWESSFQFSRQWVKYESFSARPHLHGSSLASSVLQNPAEGERIARDGIRTNPGHAGLLNSIAFCLASQGKPDEAKKIIQEVKIDESPLIAKICLIATMGLIEYRLGSHDGGRILYERAIAEAVKHNKPELKARAMLYLAREEGLAGRPKAEVCMKEAIAEAAKFPQLDLQTLAAIFSTEIQNVEIKRKSSVSVRH